MDRSDLMPGRALPAARLLSAAEFLLGACIVIGHNVYHVVPNEVPMLMVLGLVSIRLRGDGFAGLGFRRPASWGRLVLIALAAAAVRIILGDVVLEPLTSAIWPPQTVSTVVESTTGDLKQALLGLLLVWTFAAFGEEFGYRGYMLSRAADAGGKSRAAWWIGIVLVSVLFGYGHYYKGPAGMVDSGLAGMVLGAAYMAAGRNLWACVLAHGFIDTFAITIYYLGWQS